jgi:hypothetical protein
MSAAAGVNDAGRNKSDEIAQQGQEDGDDSKGIIIGDDKV